MKISVPRCQESLQGTLWCANSLTRLVRSYQGGLRAFRASTDSRYPKTVSKNQLHYHIPRQESGSSRGVPDPSASLDAIHPADRSSPHVSGSKDLNLLLPQVWISSLQTWSMAPPQAPPLQLVQTLLPTRFKTPSFNLKLEKSNVLKLEGLWISIDCTGCRKKTELHQNEHLEIYHEYHK